MTIRKLLIGAGLNDQELQAKTAAFLDGALPPIRVTLANKAKKAKLVLPEFPDYIVQPGESVEATFHDPAALHRCIYDAATIARINDRDQLAEFALDIPKAKAENSEAKA